MSRLPRRLSVAIVTAVLSSACRGGSTPPPSSSGKPSATPQPGGTFATTFRAEPSTFNRYVNQRAITEIFTKLVHAKLVRVNRVTDELEPWLAERWTSSPDGLEHTLTLREGLTFSDGTALTADDVLFSFAAVYDERSNSQLAEALSVNKAQLQVSARDPRTVVIRFPSPYGPGLRMLDILPIYPKHKLEAIFTAGKFAEAWGASTPPADLVGAGPFVFSEYRPGQRLVFVKNPRYWRRDDRGTALPYLDRIVVDIVPDQNAELVRMQAGQLDTLYSEISAADYSSFKRAAETGRLRIVDLGPAIDVMGLWFSLKPKAKADPRSAWMHSEDFRHAISLAVDRRAFADQVYFGAATPTYSPVSPGNKRWYSAAANTGAHDPQKARAILKTLGLVDRNGDSMLEDAQNRPVRFNIHIPAGNALMERGASFLRTELAKFGITADVVILDTGAHIDRLLKGDYDAMYYVAQQSDVDPAINIDYWVSSGVSHVWHMQQRTPATGWERQIDDLMRRQATTVDYNERKRIFEEVQKIFVQHEPVVFFAVPTYYVALNSRVTHATPALLIPPVLWDADMIAVRPESAGR